MKIHCQRDYGVKVEHKNKCNDLKASQHIHHCYSDQEESEMNLASEIELRQNIFCHLERLIDVLVSPSNGMRPNLIQKPEDNRNERP